jgi:hypothetical protein
MRVKLIGNKADKVIMNVRNDEASASIPAGTPVILNLSTTASASADGLGVVLPATAGDPLSFAAKYGVLTNTLAVGQYGETVLFGIVTNALIARATRASSTASFSTYTTIASGIGLGIDTVNNAFGSAGASVAGIIASNAMMAILLDSLGSGTGSASTTSVTANTKYDTARVFLRML